MLLHKREAFSSRISTESLYPKGYQVARCSSNPVSVTAGSLLGRISRCWLALWAAGSVQEILTAGGCERRWTARWGTELRELLQLIPTDLYFSTPIFIWLKKGRHFAESLCGHQPRFFLLVAPQLTPNTFKRHTKAWPGLRFEMNTWRKGQATQRHQGDTRAEHPSSSSFDRSLLLLIFRSWQRSCKSNFATFSLPTVPKNLYVFHLC